jgi:hypothetical protein
MQKNMVLTIDHTLHQQRAWTRMQLAARMGKEKKG